MGQGDSARDFGTSESMKNAGILAVFPIFHTARLGQKIRRSPQLPLCGVALIYPQKNFEFLFHITDDRTTCHSFVKKESELVHKARTISCNGL